MNLGKNIYRLICEPFFFKFTDVIGDLLWYKIVINIKDRVSNSNGNIEIEIKNSFIKD